MDTIAIQKVALSGLLLFGAGGGASFALVNAIQKSVSHEQQKKKEKAPSDKDTKKKPDPLADALEDEQTDQQVLGMLVAQVARPGKKAPSKMGDKKERSTKVGPAAPYLATKVAIVEDNAVRGIVIHRTQGERGNELKSSGQVILEPEKIREKYLVAQGRLPEDGTEVRTCKELHNEDESFRLVEHHPDTPR